MYLLEHVLYSPPHNYPYQAHIGDRTCGILMQLISCLQCRRCPHYFLPAVDLFRGTFLSPFHVESYHALHTKSSFLKISSSPGKSPSSLDNAAKLAWRLLRELLTNGKALENLWKIKKICTNPQEIWKNLWRNQICLEMTKAQWPQKSAVSIDFLHILLQAYSTDFRSCTFSKGGLTQCCGKDLPLFFRYFLN